MRGVLLGSYQTWQLVQPESVGFAFVLRLCAQDVYLVTHMVTVREW